MRRLSSSPRRFTSGARSGRKPSRRCARRSARTPRGPRAGSTEALFHLASNAEHAGRDAEALRLYRRYRDEAPAGLNAADADAAVRRLDRRRSTGLLFATSLLGLLGLIAAIVVFRAKTGATFEQWLSRTPARAPEARRIVGRLRHEALKHGGMLLSDGADRIEKGDAAARQTTAALLVSRLYGDAASRGLVVEAQSAMGALCALARADGTRLNLAHRDPVFPFLVRGIRALTRARGSLRRLARSGSSGPLDVRRASRQLRIAAQFFRLASGSEIERSVDRASALPARLDALQALLSRMAVEADRPAPAFTTAGGDLPPVRISASDWETLWRNLFSNALSASRLALSAAARRDAVTGVGYLRLVLADDLPGTLTIEEVRARSSDRGLGVVAEILRRSEGTIEIVPAPSPGFTKGIAVELPIVEVPS